MFRTETNKKEKKTGKGQDNNKIQQTILAALLRFHLSKTIKKKKKK